MKHPKKEKNHNFVCVFIYKRTQDMDSWKCFHGMLYTSLEKFDSKTEIRILLKSVAFSRLFTAMSK